MSQVSVIIPTYNSARFIRETIDSALAQTYNDLEVIVVDDGSTDGTGDIIRSYGDKVRYMYQRNAGVSAARNAAISVANGEYIALLDHDDLWMPDKLEKQLKAIASGDYALCYGGVIKIDPDGNAIGTYIPKARAGNLLNELLMQFDIYIPTVLLRKSALLESRLTFDENVTASEEYCLFMQLAVKHSFLALPEALAKYSVRSDSLTNRSIGKWAEEREYTLDLIRKNHPGIEAKYRVGFAEAYARAGYYRARYFVSQGDKLKALKELWKNIFINYRYATLFALLFLPTSVWNSVHKARLGR